MLFHVSRTGVLLCGGVHLLPEGQRLPNEFFTAVRGAEECFFEADPRDVAARSPRALYPPGETIAEKISSELLSATSNLWNQLDISGDLLSAKPWYAANVISMTLLIQKRASLEWGVDKRLLNEVVRLGKAPLFLETTEEQLEIFDTAPLSEQIRRLEFLVLDPDRAVRTFERLYRAWGVWDSACLAGELDTLLALCPVTYSRLIYERNRKWLTTILDAIKRDRTAIFVVGAFHLTGNQGCQRLLEECGHQVVRIELSGTTQ